MEHEIFIADKKAVKALGITIDCTGDDLHIYINGVDILRTASLEEIRITFEKKEAQAESKPKVAIITSKSDKKEVAKLSQGVTE